MELRNRVFSTLLSVLVLGLLMACNSQTTAPNQQLSLTGDVSAAYNNGRFVIWTPKEDEPQSTGMAPAMSMSSASNDGTKQFSITDSLNVVAEAPIGEDGTFALETTVDTVQQVYFYILDATNEDGMTLAPTKGQQFILEPGNLTLTMNRHRKFVVSGGYFNDEVFNSWKTSEKYTSSQEDYYDFITSPSEEATEEEQLARAERISELSSRLLDIESEGRREVALLHEDPEVRKLVLQTTWLIDSWYNDAVKELSEELPDDPWVTEALQQVEIRIEAAKAREQFAIGKTVKDFTAATLSGEEVTLLELVEGKSVVLLEFWASWCGPCRVEIPHMKEAYDRFKDKGFEIVSFTIDDFHEDWELASEEEELPWLNLGMGTEAEAAKAYSVVGVPDSYLFDARTNTIIARGLRGKALDQALEEELL
ncbi:MAG: TlpA disulfide reductase family protein [Gammaproteobacteria bacterium]|nr:TlpA disulfide reductase family protein [Gammaproteobacteria bacterium]MDE0252690.1 TlpA disulfide reductase family protein [Gammaproteobacteria bacterium]MDE0402378.1 TlpA disulfide reductase family protein [Gammaproteobacteria bacterium]